MYCTRGHICGWQGAVAGTWICRNDTLGDDFMETNHSNRNGNSLKIAHFEFEIVINCFPNHSVAAFNLQSNTRSSWIGSYRCCIYPSSMSSRGKRQAFPMLRPRIVQSLGDQVLGS